MQSVEIKTERALSSGLEWNHVVLGQNKKEQFAEGSSKGA